MFCLTEEGEQQIDWVPEKDWLSNFRKARHLPNFHAKTDSWDATNMADKFAKLRVQRKEVLPIAFKRNKDFLERISPINLVDGVIYYFLLN